MRYTHLVYACVCLCGVVTEAAPLTSGNIVVAIGLSDQSATRFGEYTPAGSLVQSYTISAPNGTQAVISGLTVGPNSQPYVYVGNFNPQLWTVNTSTNVQSTQTTSGWSNVGDTVSGALAAYQNYIFATSENAGSSTGGIFRFDLNTGTAVQMFDPSPSTTNGNTSYDKVAIGYNNELYGLLNNGGYSSPYLVSANPITGAGFTVTTLSESVNAIAADANGDLFVLRGNSNGTNEGIDEFSPSFTLLGSLNLPNDTLAGTSSNIELSPSGNIVAISTGGTVLQTTAALSSYTTFNVGPSLDPGKDVYYSAVGFVQAPVPEPSCSLLVIAIAASLRRPRSRKDQS